MQNKWFIALLLALVLLVSGCMEQPEGKASQPTYTIPETRPAELSVETVPATHPTQPLHAPLFLADCTTEQMTAYFEEVVLNVEYTDGTGADDHVKKWLTPIYYQIYGEPTETDREVLATLCEQLNAIAGFPGIYEAEELMQQNVSISFMEPLEFRDSFSDVINGEEAFGAVQFWYYTETNELHTARIGCRMDVDQETRNSVLQEEIINILGISDTVLRPDSITYQYSDANTALSDVDRVILKLLYDPAIRCGFDADSCRAVIQELYY